MANPIPDYPTPWAIACVFRSEDGNIFQTLNLLPAHREADAAGAAVSMYYRAGGTLPLFSVTAALVPEEMCRAAVAMYEETARLKKAEADKVVMGRFPVLSRDQGPSPIPEQQPMPPEGAT